MIPRSSTARLRSDGGPKEEHDLKLGFIDYYLDEWHANNYPQWISEASGGEMEITYAWALADSPKGGLTSAEWCKKFGVELCTTVEELIEKSDGLIILSPDNCELHEQLCRLPLSSGKPCYVDKTFAPDEASAKRVLPSQKLPVRRAGPPRRCALRRNMLRLILRRLSQSIRGGRTILKFMPFTSWSL